MRTTIDGAGRVVIPKPIREAAGLTRSAEVDIEFRDGRIEIDPATVPMSLAKGESGTIINAEVEMPPLTSEDVRDALERVRR